MLAGGALLGTAVSSVSIRPNALRLSGSSSEAYSADTPRAIDAAYLLILKVQDSAEAIALPAELMRLFGRFQKVCSRKFAKNVP